MDTRIWESIAAQTRELIRGATISVDAATAETYTLNRRGGDFKTFLRRLAYIAELRKSGPLDYFEIYMTVQANNFREMADFVQLGRSRGCDRVAFHQLLDWGSFTPSEYAARAIQRPDHPSTAPFRHADRPSAGRPERSYVESHKPQE
jgi:MoaA/NifB/PqqE/SkfB family radical SAM enzyme